MQKRHWLSFGLGIVFILLGLSIIPTGIYYSDYVYENFPEVRFDVEDQDSDYDLYSEEQGVWKSFASKTGLDKLANKVDGILQEQKRVRKGYNDSFYNIQSEIKYVLKMQSMYLVVTAVMISIIFIIFGAICLAIHYLLVYQSKTYLLEESIKKEILINREQN